MVSRDIRNAVKEKEQRIEYSYHSEVRDRYTKLQQDIQFLEKKGYEVLRSSLGPLPGFVAWIPQEKDLTKKL